MITTGGKIVAGKTTVLSHKSRQNELNVTQQVYSLSYSHAVDFFVDFVSLSWR